MKTTSACLLSLILAGVLHAAEPYSCGPFLLQPDTDRMTVVIDHEKPVTASLTYSRADGKGKKLIEHEKPMRHHLFVLEGLEPDSEYRYEIKTGRKHASGRRAFRTLPERPDEYRLIALGDVRSQPHIWHRVSQRIFENEKKALFIIGSGDYPADGRQYKQWIGQFFAPGRDLLGSMPIWPSIGNHERTRGNEDLREEESHYFSLFELPGNERWYRVDYRFLTLLVIDSNSQMTSDSEQYAWLLEQLRSERGRFTVAAFHHDPVTSGPHGRLNPDGTPRERPIDQAQRFLMPLFEMYGVDLVLNGHDHIYERSFKDGVYYVVTGGGGAPLYKINSVENEYQQIAASVYHYTTLDVDREAIRLTAIDIDGEIFDWVKIPVSPKSLERLRHFTIERLREGMQVGAYEEDTQSALCTVGNALEVPLQITVAVQKEDGEPQLQDESELAPGAKKQVRVDLRGFLPVADEPTWRKRTAALVKFALKSEEGEVEIDRKVILREPVYTVAHMASPQVDGDLSEWEKVPAMTLDSKSQIIDNPEGYGGEEDMRARVCLGWSAGMLHLSVEVRDDALVDDPESPIWENDSVEIFFDGRPEEERSDRYDEWVAQNIFPVLRNVDEKFVGTRSWERNAFAWKVEKNSGGYTLEASIPFSLLTGKEQRQAGDTLRFEVMVNDRDKDATSRHRLWSRVSASSDPSEFGVLVLGE